MYAFAIYVTKAFRRSLKEGPHFSRDGCFQGRQMSKLFSSLLKQETHGPRVAHLSDIATANMQMLCNIFPILSSQLMKRSSFKQFLILKKNIYGMTVNGARSFEQTLNHISTVGLVVS